MPLSLFPLSREGPGNRRATCFPVDIFQMLPQAREAAPYTTLALAFLSNKLSLLLK